VCETKFSESWSDKQNVDAYEGYLVAESVPPEAMPLILRAPQMEAQNAELAAALRKFLEAGVGFSTDPFLQGEATTMARLALSKRGGQS
jgi:hypothetical protein